MKKKAEPMKLYVVRKYISTTSAQEAIKKDRNTPVDDVWVDDTSKQQLSSAIGFVAEKDYED